MIIEANREAVNESIKEDNAYFSKNPLLTEGYRAIIPGEVVSDSEQPYHSVIVTLVAPGIKVKTPLYETINEVYALIASDKKPDISLHQQTITTVSQQLAAKGVVCFISDRELEATYGPVQSHPEQN